MEKRKTIATKQVQRKTVQVNPKGIQNRQELSVGLEVVHRVFGKGKILSVDSKVKIQFEHEQKEFDTNTILQYGFIERV